MNHPKGEVNKKAQKVHSYIVNALIIWVNFSLTNAQAI